MKTILSILGFILAGLPFALIGWLFEVKFGFNVFIPEDWMKLSWVPRMFFALSVFPALLIMLIFLLGGHVWANRLIGKPKEDFWTELRNAILANSGYNQNVFKWIKRAFIVWPPLVLAGILSM